MKVRGEVDKRAETVFTRDMTKSQTPQAIRDFAACRGLKFTTNGDNGPCGHWHKTPDAAHKCQPDSLVIGSNNASYFYREPRYGEDFGRWVTLSEFVGR